ncbi:MAG: hypothetical protein ACKPEA_08380, partial [Planctomycetota bacterium]
RIQGTPGYIAPEQAQRAAITPATDVYNFGATMHWVLMGEVMPTVMPPAGDGPVSTVDVEMLKMPRPLHERNPRIPVPLSELVLDCVRPAAEERIGVPQVITRLESLASELADVRPIPLWNNDRPGK